MAVNAASASGAVRIARSVPGHASPKDDFSENRGLIGRGAGDSKASPALGGRLNRQRWSRGSFGLSQEAHDERAAAQISRPKAAEHAKRFLAAGGGRWGNVERCAVGDRTP